MIEHYPVKIGPRILKDILHLPVIHMITHFDDQTAPKAFSALQARVEEDAKQESSNLALL